MTNRSRNHRVAVVGSGPAGCFTISALLKANQDIGVDLFERLPFPYGLVRYGIAPDHPGTKRVIQKFDEIFQARNVRFLGNVNIGTDISARELKSFYDAVVFTSGAAVSKEPGCLATNLSGVHPAIDFVGWYNGHPDYRNKNFDLNHDTAVVIGNGNVAIDVARLLAKPPADLKQTDISRYAYEGLAKSAIRNVYVIGRRGPAQASFSYKEIKELAELGGCNLMIDSGQLELSPASVAELELREKANQRRIVELFTELVSGSHRFSGSKSIHLRFLRSPTSFGGEGSVENIVLEKNELVGDVGQQTARGLKEFETLDCGLVFYALGYRAQPITGVPFDQQAGVFPNTNGRILSDGQVVPGLYAAGWTKRGSVGLVGTNKRDSSETVQSLLEDLARIEPCHDNDVDEISKLLDNRGVRVINFEDWKEIDALEIERGSAIGKPREKMYSIEDALSAL